MQNNREDSAPRHAAPGIGTARNRLLPCALLGVSRSFRRGVMRGNASLGRHTIGGEHALLRTLLASVLWSTGWVAPGVGI